MAGEYFRWKYKDVKPDPKPVYTKAQLRRNWWDYHWKFLLLGLVVLVALFFLIRDIFFRVEADYEVAFVSRGELDENVRASLQARLEELGEDLNGDGKVVVDLYSYVVGFDEQGMKDVQAFTAVTTTLTVNLSSGDIYIVLTDDPEGFQRRMGALAYLDGSVPSEDNGYSAADWRSMVYPWSGCPVLKSMDLGTYVPFLDISGTELDGQTALEGIYIGRRITPNEKDAERFAGAERLWQKLTAGAQREE